MKIPPVSSYSYRRISKNKDNLNKKQNENVFSLYFTKENRTFVPTASYFVNFGISKNVKSLTKKNENTPFLQRLKDSDLSAFEVKTYLNELMNSEESRECFFDELTGDPTKSQENVELLQKKLGGIENFTAWYMSKNGYIENYEKYLNTKYEKAKNIDELLKIQPNWGYWAFERKQVDVENLSGDIDELMRDRKINFFFGKLPKDFGNKSDFDYICNDLKHCKFGIKDKIVKSGKYSFIVDQLSGGDKSSKNIYKLKTERGNNYIVKMDRFYPEDMLSSLFNHYYSRIAKEAKMLRGDSVYLDACIDRYLELNGVNSTAKLLYYDFENNASIYEYIDCEELELQNDNKNIEQYEANQLFKDINAAGIYLNDIGLTYNCYKDKNGAYRVIDVGHSEYIDILKPGAKLLTIEPSNLCGFSYKSLLSGLNMKMLDSVNMPDYKISLGEFDKISYQEFVKEKNVLKQTIKNKIQTISYYEGENSRNILLERFSLLDFYIKDILARKAGYAENTKEVIDGIIKAMNREMNNIRKNDLNEEFKEKCLIYEQFISRYKEGNL